MLAAATTLWAMFSVWLVAPRLGIARATAHTAAALLVVELVALLAWSYGTERCDDAGCSPLAQAAGTAARTDVPILAAIFVTVTVARLRRAALR